MANQWNPVEGYDLNLDTWQGFEYTPDELQALDELAYQLSIGALDTVGDQQGLAGPAFAPLPQENADSRWVAEFHRLRRIGEIDNYGISHGVGSPHIKQEVSRWLRYGIPKNIQNDHKEIKEALLADRHLGCRFTLAGAPGLQGTWSENYEQYYRHLGGRIPSEAQEPANKAFRKCHKRLYSHQKKSATANSGEFDFFESHPDWKEYFLPKGTTKRDYYERILAEQRGPALPTPGPSTVPVWQSAPVPTPTNPAAWNPTLSVAGAAGMSLTGAGHRPPVGSFPPPATHGTQQWQSTPGTYQPPGSAPRQPSPRH
ncbi:hypothetical protein ABT336_11570 [Micromonospora sp. NPDC000207]|uniref:hypothetical protein n=1 Tax=Micromonospora sp. NPDC000207 TaxID=3154246 RepID=UPI00331D37E8